MGKDDTKKCYLCGSSQLKLVYSGPMRHSGDHKVSNSAHEIYFCSQCKVEFIYPFPSQKETIYHDGTYWSNNKLSDDKKLDKIHYESLRESTLWLNKIDINSLKGKVVIDFGCGTGSFLDIIKNVAAQTIGVEADHKLCDYVTSKGHIAYNSIEDIIKAKTKADIICSFDVLEHLQSPVTIIQKLRKILYTNGTIYIGVPNQSDFIKELVPAYLGHFYHFEHLWYYSPNSLTYVLNKSGFKLSAVQYMHKYNFMNLIEWAKTNKAPGLPQSDVIDKGLDNRLIDWLEDRGLASHFLLTAKN